MTLSEVRTVVRRWRALGDLAERHEITTVDGLRQQVQITVATLQPSLMYLRLSDALLKRGHPVGTTVEVDLTREGVAALHEACGEWLKENPA
jgi:hypothetical protein